ncbi:cupin domain-containing protein [Tissierella praeacuta]|uniref:cupin domain-containing protein n=1 Tax=Tissierella praeacuta TaxID=43131 RepID=UPI003DA5F654
MTVNLLNKKDISSIKKFSDNQEFVIAKRTQHYRIFLAKVTDIEFAAHNSIELIYVIEGKVKIQVRSHTRTLNKGDFHIINSKNAHCIYQNGGENVLLCFQIYPEYLEKSLGIEGDYIFSNDIKDIEVKRNIEYALGLLYIESLNYKDRADVKNKGITILLESIKHYLMTKECIEVVDINNNAECIVHDILERYSDTFASEDITLAKIALEYNISYSYLSRVFKTVTGINFISYFSKQRLNKAIDLLLNTNKTGLTP